MILRASIGQVGFSFVWRVAWGVWDGVGVGVGRCGVEVSRKLFHPFLILFALASVVFFYFLGDSMSGEFFFLCW